MKIKYWTSFSKRKNSTLTPSGGTEIDAVLKGPTSELNPVFELQGVTSAKYVYCATFGRYYYVTDVVHLSNNVIQLVCAVDPMSSHKGSIGGVYANVEYTSSSDNVLILDPRNRPTGDVQSVTTELFTLGSGQGFNSSGCYIVGLLCNEGIKYCAMSASDLSGLCGELLNLGNSSAVNNGFYGISNCILSCMYSPFVPTDVTPYVLTIGGDTTSQPKITALDIGPFNVINHRLKDLTLGTYTIGFPGDSWGTGHSYLDCAPYSVGSLYLPFVGCVSLDLDIFAEDRSITIKGAIDSVTGDIVYTLARNSNDCISTFSGNYGVNVPVGGMQTNSIGQKQGFLSILGSAVTAIGGLATENPALIAGGLIGMTSGAIQSMQGIQTHTQINGSVSSAVGYKLGNTAKSFVCTRVPSETDLDSFKSISGMPYFKSATISSLSGFVKCSGASVSISGYDSEREEINGYLNSGFYYE